MNHQIRHWLQQVDVLTRSFKESFGHLSPEELNRKPDTRSWSVAQNIQHIVIVNQSFFPAFRALKERKCRVPFIGKLPFYVKFMGDAMLKSVEPSRKKKSKTFSLWEPPSIHAGEPVTEQFVRHQETLKKIIIESEPALTCKSVISSPVNKNIVYTLERTFDILIAHEERHLNQAAAALARGSGI